MKNRNIKMLYLFNKIRASVAENRLIFDEVQGKKSEDKPVNLPEAATPAEGAAKRQEAGKDAADKLVTSEKKDEKPAEDQKAKETTDKVAKLKALAEAASKNEGDKYTKGLQEEAQKVMARVAEIEELLKDPKALEEAGKADRVTKSLAKFDKDFPDFTQENVDANAKTQTALVDARTALAKSKTDVTADAVLKKLQETSNLDEKEFEAKKTEYKIDERIAAAFSQVEDLIKDDPKADTAAVQAKIDKALATLEKLDIDYFAKPIENHEKQKAFATKAYEYMTAANEGKALNFKESDLARVMDSYGLGKYENPREKAKSKAVMAALKKHQDVLKTKGLYLAFLGSTDGNGYKQDLDAKFHTDKKAAFEGLLKFNTANKIPGLLDANKTTLINAYIAAADDEAKLKDFFTDGADAEAHGHAFRDGGGLFDLATSYQRAQDRKRKFNDKDDDTLNADEDNIMLELGLATGLKNDQRHSGIAFYEGEAAEAKVATLDKKVEEKDEEKPDEEEPKEGKTTHPKKLPKTDKKPHEKKVGPTAKEEKTVDFPKQSETDHQYTLPNANGNFFVKFLGEDKPKNFEFGWANQKVTFGISKEPNDNYVTVTIDGRTGIVEFDRGTKELKLSDADPKNKFSEIYKIDKPNAQNHIILRPLATAKNASAAPAATQEKAAPAAPAAPESRNPNEIPTDKACGYKVAPGLITVISLKNGKEVSTPYHVKDDTVANLIMHIESGEGRRWIAFEDNKQRRHITVEYNPKDQSPHYNEWYLDSEGKILTPFTIKFVGTTIELNNKLVANPAPLTTFEKSIDHSKDSGQEKIDRAYYTAKNISYETEAESLAGKRTIMTAGGAFPNNGRVFVDRSAEDEAAHPTNFATKEKAAPSTPAAPTKAPEKHTEEYIYTLSKDHKVLTLGFGDEGTSKYKIINPAGAKLKLETVNGDTLVDVELNGTKAYFEFNPADGKFIPGARKGYEADEKNLLKNYSITCDENLKTISIIPKAASDTTSKTFKSAGTTMELYKTPAAGSVAPSKTFKSTGTTIGLNKGPTDASAAPGKTLKSTITTIGFNKESVKRPTAAPATAPDEVDHSYNPATKELKLSTSSGFEIYKLKLPKGAKVNTWPGDTLHLDITIDGKEGDFKLYNKRDFGGHFPLMDRYEKDDANKKRNDDFLKTYDVKVNANTKPNTIEITLKANVPPAAPAATPESQARKFAEAKKLPYKSLAEAKIKDLDQRADKLFYPKPGFDWVDNPAGKPAEQQNWATKKMEAPVAPAAAPQKYTVDNPPDKATNEAVWRAWADKKIEENKSKVTKFDIPGKEGEALNGRNFKPEVQAKIDGLKKLIATGITIVDFSATNCGPCHFVEPLFYQVAGEGLDHSGQKVKFANFNIQSIDDPDHIARIFGVGTFPSTVVFKDGKPIIKAIGGSKNKDLLRARVDKLLKVSDENPKDLIEEENLKLAEELKAGTAELFDNQHIWASNNLYARVQLGELAKGSWQKIAWQKVAPASLGLEKISTPEGGFSREYFRMRSGAVYKYYLSNQGAWREINFGQYESGLKPQDLVVEKQKVKARFKPIFDQVGQYFTIEEPVYNETSKLWSINCKHKGDEKVRGTGGGIVYDAVGHQDDVRWDQNSERTMHILHVKAESFRKGGDPAATSKVEAPAPAPTPESQARKFAEAKKLPYKSLAEAKIKDLDQRADKLFYPKPGFDWVDNPAGKPAEQQNWATKKMEVPVAPAAALSDEPPLDEVAFAAWSKNMVEKNKDKVKKFELPEVGDKDETDKKFEAKAVGLLKELDAFVKQKGISVVDFSAEKGCPPCTKFKPVFYQMAGKGLESGSNKVRFASFTEAILSDFQKSAVLRKTLHEKYGLSEVPCILIFKDGKFISRSGPERSREKFEKELKNLIDLSGKNKDEFVDDTYLKLKDSIDYGTIESDEKEPVANFSSRINIAEAKHWEAVVPAQLGFEKCQAATYHGSSILRYKKADNKYVYIADGKLVNLGSKINAAKMAKEKTKIKAALADFDAKYNRFEGMFSKVGEPKYDEATNIWCVTLEPSQKFKDHEAQNRRENAANHQSDNGYLVSGGSLLKYEREKEEHDGFSWTFKHIENDYENRFYFLPNSNPLN